MTKIEKKIMDFLLKYRRVVFLFIITIFACVVRYNARKFESADYEICLKGWYNYFCDNGGLLGLSKQVGNYPIIYQFFIALMTYIPVNELYLYKMISILFDFVLAIASGYFVNLLIGKKELFTAEFSVAYSAILFMPTIFINSSVWAQCDSIYASFCLLCVIFLFKERYNFSFVFFGIALAFKLQAIFLLPFLIVYYLCSRKIRITKFLFVPISFWIMGLPGYIYGRSWLDSFRLIKELTDCEHAMQNNAPNIWVIMPGEYEYFSQYGTVLLITILGISLLYLLEKKSELCNWRFNIMYLCWTIWTCFVVLPGMHDRYSYLVCVFLIIGFIYTKRIQLLVCLVIEQLCIISTYMGFLYSAGVNSQFVSFVYIFLYLSFAVFIWQERNVKN